jgi:hypothetical protein
VKKFHVEEKIDACMQPAFDRNVDLTQTDWQKFLRKPEKGTELRNPYEAKFGNDNLPPSKYVPHGIVNKREKTE